MYTKLIDIMYNFSEKSLAFFVYMCYTVEKVTLRQHFRLGGGTMKLKSSKVFDEYPNPIFIIKPILADGVSEDFEYIYVNNAMCKFLGIERDELVGHTFLETFKTKGERHWLDLFVDVAFGSKHTYVDYVSHVINKKMYTEVFHIRPNLCGCIIHDFKVLTDDIRAYENEELRHKANDDCLTGFYNRFYLSELRDDITGERNVGITFLDINNLKNSNDTLGHAAGDELIVRVSQMIRSIYDGSTFFRVGGDEFVIITTGISRDGFLNMSQKAQAEFEKDNLAAIGYDFYEKVDDLDKCISHCDTLMYEHKRQMKK
jgi:diguanylate cyclase (GGDEF)-like protein